MAVISLTSIIATLNIGDVFSRRNDAKYWSGWVEGDGPTRKIKVSAASLDESGLELVIEDGATQIALAAVPDEITSTKVLVNNEEQTDAAMVFDFKPSIGNVTRWAFDFRPIKIGDKKMRFNTRYDP